MAGETLNTDHTLETDKDKAAHIFHQYREWNSYKEPAIDKWQEIEAYTYATDTKNPKMGATAFDHSTHIPVVAPIAQDLDAIIGQVVMPHDDWFTFKPEDEAPAAEESRLKVLSYIKNRHRVSQFKRTVRKLISDYRTYGNAFAHVMFVNEQEGNAPVGYIGPKVQRISPYDIVFDPTADSFADAPKIIRQISW